jgi:hypothetical protein
MHLVRRAAKNSNSATSQFTGKFRHSLGPGTDHSSPVLLDDLAGISSATDRLVRVRQMQQLREVLRRAASAAPRASQSARFGPAPSQNRRRDAAHLTIVSTTVTAVPSISSGSRSMTHIDGNQRCTSSIASEIPCLALNAGESTSKDDRHPH